MTKIEDSIKQDLKGVGWIRLSEHREVVGSCENCTQPSGSLIYWAFHTKLSDYQLLKDSVPDTEQTT
jgi:hypothetical protein